MVDLDEDESLEQLRKAAVVGLTTTGAAKYQSLVRQLGCRVLVMEEAAEVLEAHVLASINASTQQLLLIGDHQQLRPSAACHELTLRYAFNVSLFERALNNDVPFVRLRTQRRMRPAISRLIAPIYPDLLNHPTTKGRPRIAGLTTCVHFITHNAPERARDDLQSPENPHEVAILTMLCALLHGVGYAPSRITVLSAYVGQLLLLRAALTACGLEKVLVSTVDAYQGEENDIVLLSLVRSNSQGKLGFTSVDNRVCVALSRARLGFFCACNLPMLSGGSELWEKLFSHAKREHRAGPMLPLATDAAISAQAATKTRRAERKEAEYAAAVARSRAAAEIMNDGEEVAPMRADPPPAPVPPAPPPLATQPSAEPTAAPQAPVATAPLAAASMAEIMAAARANAARLSAGQAGGGRMSPERASGPALFGGVDASRLMDAADDSMVGEALAQPGPPLPPAAPPTAPAPPTFASLASVVPPALAAVGGDDEEEPNYTPSITPVDGMPTGGEGGEDDGVAYTPSVTPPPDEDRGDPDETAPAAPKDAPAPSLPPSPPGAEAASAADGAVDGATNAGDVGDGPSDDEGGGFAEALPDNWPSLWQQCVNTMDDLAKGRPNIMPVCGAKCSDGSPCARTVHLIGGLYECRSAKHPNLVDDEFNRWRPLRDALTMKRDGTVEVEQVVAEDAEAEATRLADERDEADKAAAAKAAAKPPPKKNIHGVGQNLSLVGYNAAPMKVRAQSMQEWTKAYEQPSKTYIAGSSRAGDKRRMPSASASGSAPALPDDAPPPTPREAAAIARGWSKSWSSSHQKPFWFHAATKRRAWTVEKLEALERDGGEGSRRDGGASSSGTKGGDEPVWKACFSSKRQRNFYVNRLTKERSWHKPDGFIE